MFFAKIYFFTLLLLIFFGLIGGFLIIPLKNQLKYWLFATPMAGLLFSALGISALYSLLAFSLVQAATVVSIFGVATTIIFLFYFKPALHPKQLLLLFMAMIIAALIVYLINYTSIQYGHFGFLYMDGTDQLGYSQLADWLRNHNVHQPPILDSHLSYQSWPAIMFQIDPRFGCLYILAFISTLIGQTGMFTFDFACSLILVAACIGISALFSRSRLTFILLLIGLAIAHWFELSRTGFFGKEFGYTAAIYVIGIFFIVRKENELKFLALAAIITCGSAIVYPGIVVALFLMLTGFLFLLFRLSYDFRSHRQIKLKKYEPDFFTIFLLLMLAIAATGVLSKPLFLGFPENHFSWYYSLTLYYEVQAIPQTIILSWLTPAMILFFTLIISISLLLTLLLSIYKRNAVSSALITVPLILFLLLFIFNAKPVAYEILGIMFPFTLCGIVWLVDEYAQKMQDSSARKNWVVYFLLFILSINIILRIPRFIDSVYRYAGPGITATVQYSKTQLEGLAKAIGTKPVTIELDSVYYALPILVEFGSRKDNMDLQWSPQAWKAILGYRPWLAPKIAPSTLNLILSTAQYNTKDCQVVYKTRQYLLISCNKSI